MGVHAASVGGPLGGGRGGASTPAAHRGWRFLPLSRLAGGAANAIPVRPSGGGHGSLGIFERTSPTLPERDDAVLFLSGSQSKIKKLLHRCAAQARANGARVLSLTDSNDRELVEGSDLGILIPSLLEAPACTLTMFMLEWLAMEALRAAKP